MEYNPFNKHGDYDSTKETRYFQDRGFRINPLDGATLIANNEDTTTTTDPGLHPQIQEEPQEKGGGRDQSDRYPDPIDPDRFGASGMFR